MSQDVGDVELWRPILAYATALDTKDFAGLAKVFHPDVLADYSGTKYSGLASIIDRMTTVHELIGGSRHRLSNFRVLSRSEDRAASHTYVDAFLVGCSGAADLTYQDIGTYVDELGRFGDQWLITNRSYQRLYRAGDVAALSISRLLT